MKHLFIFFIFHWMSMGFGAKPIEIKVVGTDLLQATLQQSLAAFAQDYEQWSLNVDLFGSMPALEMMKAGEADLAIVAIPDDSPKPSADFEVVPFAFQTAVIIVKDINPLVEINFPQLKGIYGTTSEVNYTRWNEMGLTGVWSNRPIQALALDKGNSVVFELFKFKALERSPLKSNVSLIPSEQELLSVMGTDSASIAVIDRVPQSDQYRALSVASGEPGEFAFGPTPENVFYGDYLMRLPLYIVFRAEKKQQLKNILHYLLSSDISNILAGDGFMPLPENVRRRTILELDIEP